MSGCRMALLTFLAFCAGITAIGLDDILLRGMFACALPFVGAMIAMVR